MPWPTRIGGGQCSGVLDRAGLGQPTAKALRGHTDGQRLPLEIEINESRLWVVHDHTEGEPQRPVCKPPLSFIIGRHLCVAELSFETLRRSTLDCHNRSFDQTA